MEITINNKTFTISRLHYELDENDQPIDIVIYSNEKTLNEIADFASIGVNIIECEFTESIKYNASHMGLFARLDTFTVKNLRRVDII